VGGGSVGRERAYRSATVEPVKGLETIAYVVTGAPVDASRSIRSAARTLPGDACSC
jgi:hypothetical protein